MEGNYQRYPNKNNDLGCLKPARLGRHRTENRFGFVPALRNENNETKKTSFPKRNSARKKGQRNIFFPRRIGLSSFWLFCVPLRTWDFEPKSPQAFRVLAFWLVFSLTYSVILSLSLARTNLLFVAWNMFLGSVPTRGTEPSDRIERRKKKLSSLPFASHVSLGWNTLILSRFSVYPRRLERTEHLALNYLS